MRRIVNGIIPKLSGVNGPGHLKLRRYFYKSQNAPGQIGPGVFCVPCGLIVNRTGPILRVFRLNLPAIDSKQKNKHKKQYSRQLPDQRGMSPAPANLLQHQFISSISLPRQAAGIKFKHPCRANRPSARYAKEKFYSMAVIAVINPKITPWQKAG